MAYLGVRHERVPTATHPVRTELQDIFRLTVGYCLVEVLQDGCIDWRQRHCWERVDLECR